MTEMKLNQVFTLMESGPVVLVTTHDGHKDNIMTISWTMVMDFTPVFAITTGKWNHSFAALCEQRECVIAIPTVDMLDKVVGIGTCSGTDTDKFAKFKLTPVRGKIVRAPLIKECLANIECKVIDIIEKHNIVVLEAVAACIDTERKEKRLTDGQIEPVILLTKTDMVSLEERAQLVEQIRQLGIGAQIITLSNLTGEGVDQIRLLVQPEKTYCLLGSSGVGKTTLINRLLGNSEFETGEVSHTGEGKHTTTRRHLIVLEDGRLLIDMPGMRELGMLGVSEGMDGSYSDVQGYSQNCRFTNCTHTNEPGCAVQQAIAQGELDSGHFQNYLKLKTESEFHDLSYLEKRKKDRAFGQFVHSFQKDKRRRTEG